MCYNDRPFIVVLLFFFSCCLPFINFDQAVPAAAEEDTVTETAVEVGAGAQVCAMPIRKENATVAIRADFLTVVEEVAVEVSGSLPLHPILLEQQCVTCKLSFS